MIEGDILSPDEEVIHYQNKIIERLQEQLEEANKLIKLADKAFHFGVTEELSMFGKYLEKWGVK